LEVTAGMENTVIFAIAKHAKLYVVFIYTFTAILITFEDKFDKVWGGFRFSITTFHLINSFDGMNYLCKLTPVQGTGHIMFDKSSQPFWKFLPFGYPLSERTLAIYWKGWYQLTDYSSVLA
jgi:hypothetical protein